MFAGETAALGGDGRNDRGGKERRPGPLPRCQRDLKRHPYSFYFATTPTDQPQRKGRGFFLRGWGSWGWRGGVLSVAPAGIGAVVPPPWGEPLPSPLQFKLGTKSMCMFYFWFYFTLFFLFDSLFFFVCGRRETGWGGYPLPPAQLTVQEEGSALLRPTIVQCCWCVRKRLCSYSPGPFLGVGGGTGCWAS